MDEETEKLKANQFMMYELFAAVHKKRVDILASSLTTYRHSQQRSKENCAQLWPVVMTDEEKERRRLEVEEFERQLAEKAKQEEEARKAAEAASKTGGGAKKAAQKDAKAAKALEGDEATGEEDDDEVKEPVEPFLSQDDDPSKTFEFLEFKKAMST